LDFLKKLNPFNRKKKAKDKQKDEMPNIYKSRWGDRDSRTRQGISFFIMLLVAIIAVIFFTIYLFVSIAKYQQYLKDNTTEIGTELTFAKSSAKVTLSDVWTDKDRNVTMVKLGYDKQARNLLSTKGKNYKIYLIDDEGKKPKNVEISYGLLGTQGDGYLFIKGPLEEKAYQILLTNQVELSTGSSSEGDEDVSAEEGSGDVSNQKAEKVTDASIKESLSNASKGDVSKNGILDFTKNSSEPNADYINFRVNAYSDSTKVYKGSFLAPNNDIDYGKVVRQTSLKNVIKDIDDEIKEREEKAKTYEVSLEEYEGRLKDNEDDSTAKSNVKQVKESIEENNEKLENLRKLKKRYEESNFDKSSFGEMQEDYEATPLH